MTLNIGVKQNDYILKDSLLQFTEKGNFYSFQEGLYKIFANNRDVGLPLPVDQYAKVTFEIVIFAFPAILITPKCTGASTFVKAYIFE